VERRASVEERANVATRRSPPNEKNVRGTDGRARDLTAKRASATATIRDNEMRRVRLARELGEVTTSSTN